MAELLYATSHLAGNWPSSGSLIGSNDASWAGQLNNNASYTSRWAIGDPVDPLTDSATQAVRILARKGSNSGNPSLTVNLYENGTLVQQLGATESITSTTGQIVTRTFNSSAVSDPSAVEIELEQIAAGGNPSTRNSAQAAYIEWDADTTAAGDPPGSGSFDAVDASTVQWSGERTSSAVADVDDIVSVEWSATSSGMKSAAVTVEEDFENVPNGVAITTGNTSYDLVNGDGDRVAGDTSDPIHGTTSALVTPSAFGVGQWSSWDGYGRVYYRFVTAPTTNTFLWEVRTASAVKAQVRILGSSGAIQIRNATTLAATSSVTVSDGDDLRLEWHVTSTTQELRIFHGSNVDGTTPDDTISGGADNNAGAVTIDRHGAIASGSGSWLIDSTAQGDDWIGPVPSDDPAAGSFPVNDVATTGWTGQRDSTGAFAATDQTTVQWTGTRDSGGTFAVDDQASSEWGGQRSSTGTYTAADTAIVQWSGGTGSGGAFAADDTAIVQWTGVTATSGTFTIDDAAMVSWTGVAGEETGIVDLHFVALAPELVHGPALSPELLERVALSPELAHGTPGEPVTAARSVGEPELGHGDADDPELAHGQPEAALTHGATGTPTV